MNPVAARAPGAGPTVDVHHHLLPRVVFERVKAEGSLKRLVNERIGASVAEGLHDAGAHVRAMDEAGIDAAILTYSGVSVFGPEMCRALNDGLFGVRRAFPGRLYNTVHLSLHDPDARRELERGAADLRAVAVALPTSEDDLQLDDPSLSSLWQRVADLDLPVILHPPFLPRGARTDYALERTCYRPFDTTIAAARLAYGVLPQVAGLRVVLPHLGGTSLFLRGRLAMFFDPNDRSGGGIPKTAREQRRAGYDTAFASDWAPFHYDTAGTGAWSPAVEMAVRIVGPARLLFGTDYPGESRTGETMRELVEMIDGLPIEREARRAVAGGNAAALFRIDATTTGSSAPRDDSP